MNDKIYCDRCGKEWDGVYDDGAYLAAIIDAVGDKKSA
ncbi:MAG: hypothetical protein Ta2A_12060 [Treponemataceae bacterium]|nr:MAG: hypothetical protein Ta2A_12060 [Treponemataceae bacterium]